MCLTVRPLNFRTDENEKHKRWIKNDVFQMMTPFIFLHTPQKLTSNCCHIAIRLFRKTFFRRHQIRVASTQDCLWAVDYIDLFLGPFHQYQFPTDRMKFAHLEKKDLQMDS